MLLDSIFHEGWEKLRHSAELGSHTPVPASDRPLKLLPAQGHCSQQCSGCHVPPETAITEGDR